MFNSNTRISSLKTQIKHSQVIASLIFSDNKLFQALAIGAIRHSNKLREELIALDS